MSRADTEMRAVVHERVAAVQAKDSRPLAARTADDVVVDVLPPLNSRGKDAVAGRADEWYASYGSDIGYDVEQLEVVAGVAAPCARSRGQP